MRYSKAVIAVGAALMVAVSVSAFARGSGGGGRGGHGSHSYSGGAGQRSYGGHAYSGGTRAPVAHVAPQRHFAGGASVGVFIGAPLYAPLFYPAPSYYYSPPPTYIEQAPTPAYWYFCPESNAYYPYVQECPGGWQPVLPQPAG
jgi:hypothetical protein